MNKNTLALLTLYTVPKDASGRKEASGVITADGRLIRQNLVLTLVTKGGDAKAFDSVPIGERLLFHVHFDDSISRWDRLEKMADEYNGTHGRRSMGNYDNASFRIADRDKIVTYLRDLAYPKKEATEDSVVQ